MPNVVIPTTSTTQTLTGDNGFTTEATFTANALQPAYFGRTGVGLAGANYDPFGEPALEVEFSDAVADVSFSIFDLDESLNNWDDQLRVEAYDPYGNPIPITWSSTSTGHIEEIDGSNGVLQIEASNVTTDDQSLLFVNIAGPVGSFRIFYEDGNTTTNDNGVINLENLAFTDVVPRDGTVEGTSGNDTIDASYTGDPDFDQVDNNDAILAGDTGDDDLIYGYGGNDSISAGAGADEAYGGSGNDTIDGGDADDILVGDQTTNTAGDDTLTGGTGNDTLYGDNLPDTDATAETTTFNWSGLPPVNGDDIQTGLSGTSANGDVRVRLEIEQEENFTSSTMDEASLLYDYNGANDQSSINLLGGSTGTSSDAVTAVLTFDAETAGYHNAIENVTFGIFDLDELTGQFRDQVIIRAYDPDGNLVPVALTAGNTAIVTTSVDGSGIGTASALSGAGNVNPDSIDGFVQVSVAGPVSRIEIDYNNLDPAFGPHGIRVGDLTFDTVPIDDTTGGGDDSLDGGVGDDTLYGGDGADTFTASVGNDTNFGGTGDDLFAVTDDSDTETITGGEDAGNGDIDRVDFTSPTSAAGVTITYGDTESGTYSYDGTTASGSFTEIEEIDATDFDDTIDASGATGGVSVTAGTGADTITSGQGDDSFDLGDGSADGDADQVILTDGFGSDTITGFDAPTPNGDGTFTGVDTFDVTGLNDAGNVPVNTNDVTVTDDGSGNAILTFPNGESVTLIGISPTDADDPFYLNAIGIPLPPPDGIVTGTEGADTINASYAGDLEGDRVDNSDALLTGEAPEDDIIVAGGGDDSVASGLGDDDVFGGDGADTIDGGAGADTIYGDTPQGAWYYEYYDLDPTGAPNSLAQAGFAEGTADFEGTPTSVGYTDSIAAADFDTADDYALKFSTVLNVTAGGDYTFATSSDDGSKLFINGVEVVSNDGLHALVTVTGTPVTLAPGEHLIEIIYFENDGGNQLSATISGPDTGNATTDLATYDGLRQATGDDVITGGAGDDTLFGGTGSDQFNIAEADDTDTITGGEDTGGGDTDTVDFSSVGTADGVTVNFDGDEQGTYQVGATGSDGSFAEIERIVGTDNTDTVNLTADTGGITVETGAGDDVVTSGQGDDSIATGTGQDDIVINDDFGNDTVDGGTGSDGTGDVLDGSGLTQAVTVDISAPETGTVTNGTDTLGFTEIEEIRTGSGNDTVTGSAGADVVLTGAGSDTIIAGDGSDTINAGDGNDTIDGGDGADSLIGGAGSDSISGGNGNDTINGGSGFDSIAGGTGDDSIIGGNGQDTIILEDNFGNDTINAGDGGIDGDTLDGSALTEDVTVSLTASGDGTITNGSDTATFALFEEIETGSGNDTILSNGGGASVTTGAGTDDITFGDGDTIDAGADNDTLTLAGAASGNTITIDGGDESRDGNGDLIGSGDTLALGDLADFETLSKVQDPDGSFSGSIQLLDGTTVNFTDIERIVCFTPGALIATPQGERPVETLRVGDLVVTRDHGLQPIRWIQSRTVKAKGKFAPVRIRPGAVTGLERDMLVSPQHRMLFTGYRAELLFGEREVLMPAIHMVDGKMVTRETSETVTYIHMMFDCHEVVYADGAATESFHPGDEGLAAVSGPAREELFAIFPELRSNPMGYGDTARRCLKKHETQMLQV